MAKLTVDVAKLVCIPSPCIEFPNTFVEYEQHKGLPDKMLR